LPLLHPVAGEDRVVEREVLGTAAGRVHGVFQQIAVGVVAVAPGRIVAEIVAHRRSAVEGVGVVGATVIVGVDGVGALERKLGSVPYFTMTDKGLERLAMSPDGHSENWSMDEREAGAATKAATIQLMQCQRNLDARTGR